jgi:lipopolysaccharide biosynthesis regulator YciM
MLDEGIRAGRQGNLSEASRLFEQAMVIFSRELGEDHPSTLSSMNNVATIYGALGQYNKAVGLHEQTLKLKRTKLGEDHPSTLNSMSNLALVYRALGQHDKALALNEQALKLRRAKLGEDHPSTLDSMNNLALSYRNLSQHDKALALNEQTLKLKRSKLGEDHPSTLESMHNLVMSYMDFGWYDKALAMNEQIYNFWSVKLGEDHPSTLKSRHNLAANYLALDQRDKALALFERNLKLRRAKLGEDHEETLDSMNGLANTYRTFGQHDKAVELHEQAVKLMRANLGENNPSTLKSMSLLAVTYVALGQHDKALALIPNVVAGAEKFRTLPGLATEQRQSLFAAYAEFYQLAVTWYASAQRIGEAFNLGDLSKARTLSDSIKTQAALRSLPSAEQQKLQASEGRAQALRGQIEKLSAQGTRDSGAVLSLQKQLDAQNSDHLQLVAGLSNLYPKYAQLILLKPAAAVQAKQLIGSGEVFVSYLLRQTTGMAQAFVLDASGEAKWVDLGEIKNHAKTVAAYRELISPSTEDGLQGQLVALKDGGYQWLPPGETTPPGATPATSRNLLVTGKPTAAEPAPQGASNVADALKVLNRYWYDTLIKPILPLAGPYKRWIISPDKDLALLPFDTLVEAFDATGKPTQTLVQTRNITLVQSFAVFALLKQREAEYATLQRPKELLAMGNAVYGDGWAENRGIRRGVGKRGYATRGGEATDRGYALAPLQANAEQYAMNKFAWQNLPGTAHEIQGVSAVFGDKAKPGGSSVDTYLGLDASEGKLQQLNQDGRLKDYRYLLFSAHGYLAQNPALSSLVLSQQGNPPEIDGYVTASEWPLYDMKSDLTVLSACDTGVGRTQAGESVMGLPYALFVAGNKNTLLSLWPVDDDATAEFMRRFFTHLKAGTSQPDALRKTKQEFQQHPQWSEPRYWAAFVLYGV